MAILKKILCLGLIVLSNQFLSAQEVSVDPLVDAHHSFSFHPKPSPKNCQLGSAGFSVSDPSLWYTINTQSYPTTVPLSLNRNRGFTQGNVKLKSTGLKIGQPGNYLVSFSTFLLNPNADSVLVPIFVIENGEFDPANTSLLGSVVVIEPGALGVAQGTGIIENVKAGTKLSIVATNGGSPGVTPVTVIAWDITVTKIPCRPTR